MKKQLTIQDWGTMIGRKVSAPTGIYKLINVGVGTTYSSIIISNDIIVREVLSNYDWFKMCKPVLRTIDQLTEEEKDEFKRKFIIWTAPKYEQFFERLEIANHGFYIIMKDESGSLTLNNVSGAYEAKHIDYLTRIGIDIRGWIKDGLAVKYDPEKHGEWR